MIANRVQLVGWIIFVFYYFAAKYFVGGFTGFSVVYLLSVLVLVALTAAVPFYGTKWFLKRTSGAMRLANALILPSASAAVGLSVYFLIFIAPNYPNIELVGILHRAIEPGVIVTILMLIPILGEMFAKPENSDDV